ncbi:LacI family DNA-binding transcriptional regulator [Xylanimonas ulmi]|uniref:LacI family transcriptional regulator n=1 Tax=Xylanimonas ulmi TaxID=228973 RepID=A0A4Q7M346_9MICO|nr:LacI family DNA-binding transcriptional regulator [Xylanibacterium ulmi]RZS61052.1 LacI family transcriptional regulator [Xylanibacterium ulmi]
MPRGRYRERVKTPRVTIKDVAAAAGVSPATVSFVLNRTPGQTIPAPTQARVRAAAHDLGYTPHAVARALREGRSRIVLLHVGAITGGNSLESLVDGMRAELTAHGHTLLVQTGAGAIPPEVLDVVAPRAVIDLTRLTTDDGGDIVGTAGGLVAGLALHTRTQLHYLAQRGHQRIAMALPPGDDRLIAARLEYAMTAAAELGLDPPVPVTIDLGEPPEPRRTAVARLVSESAVTAVAGYDDVVAVAVLASLTHLGLRAPDDLAVIGFDEGAHGRLWSPSLTTVRIDAAAYGRRAARVAIGVDPGPWDHTPSQVIVRESA